MRNAIPFVGVTVFILLLSSCGPARFVEPLARNENAIAVDLGGPLAKIPGVATLTIPFTSITYGRGITNRLTLHGSWYSTASIFGVAQISAGANYGFWKSKNQKHGVSGMAGFNTAFDFFEHNFKLWPQLDAHYYWKYNLKNQTQSDLLDGGRSTANLFYIGIGSWWEMDPVKVDGKRTGPFVVPMLNIGHDLNWKRWTFKAEVKFIAPFSSNQDKVVDFVSLMGKHGATGIYIGFIRKF